MKREKSTITDKKYHTSFEDISGSQEKFMLMSPRISPVLEGLLPPRNTETPAE